MTWTLRSSKGLSRKLKRDGRKIEKTYFKKYYEEKKATYDALDRRDATYIAEHYNDLVDALQDFAARICHDLEDYLKLKHNHVKEYRNIKDKLRRSYKHAEQAPQAMHDQVEILHALAQQSQQRLRKALGWLQNLKEGGQPVEFRVEAMNDEVNDVRKLRDYERLEYTAENKREKRLGEVKDAIRDFQKGINDGTAAKHIGDITNALQALQDAYGDELDNEEELVIYAVIELWNLYKNTLPDADGVMTRLHAAYEQGFPEELYEDMRSSFEDARREIEQHVREVIDVTEQDLSDTERMQ